MSVPKLLFTRHDIGLRTGVDDVTLGYWSREGLLKADAGGRGKGQHRHFSRTQLGLAAILAALRSAGVSTSALAGLAKYFHRSEAWMSERRLDAEQAQILDQLLKSRAECSPPLGSEQTCPANNSDDWQAIVAAAKADPWIDLLPSHFRLVETISLDNWRQHYDPYSILAYIALEQPKPRRRKVRLSRLDDGTWSMTPDRVEGHCFQLNLDLLAAQVWAAK